MSDVECIPFRETGYFSDLIVDYLDQKERLKPFVSDFPSVEAFAERLKDKGSFSPKSRSILVQALQKQYQHAEIKVHPAVAENIEQLNLDATFTVTTGHQLNILSGPLYFLYKIVSTINACKRLRISYPDKNFVPVYWMASEDHDFEEISFINLHGGKLRWINDLSGAVGPMPTFGMGKVLDELEEHLGASKNAQDLLQLFRKAYHEHENLSAATLYFVNELFAQEGLVVLDANSADLKRQMIPHFKTDLFESKIHDRVEEQSKLLAKEYFAQVHPRDINLFYLQSGVRERIERKGDFWEVLNTDLKFSQKELEQELESHPERFSPNVVLRPLYQEVILPNLAYIGGGGELAYWFQLKTMFVQQGVPFPLLMLRNSALLNPQKWQNRMSDLGLSMKDLFGDLHVVKKQFLAHRFPEDLELQKFDEALELMFKDLEDIAELTDRSMLGAVNAQKQKQLKGIENLRKKLVRAEKRRSQTEMEKIERIYYGLFPKGSLQERHDNLSPWFAEYGPEMIQTLLDKLDPFDYRFAVIHL